MNARILVLAVNSYEFALFSCQAVLGRPACLPLGQRFSVEYLLYAHKNRVNFFLYGASTFQMTLVV